MSRKNVGELAAYIFVIALAIASGTGCKANFPESPTPLPTLAAIQIHYSSPHHFISPGRATTLSLYAIDSEGIYTDISLRAQWVSMNPELASITNGRVTGVADGFTDVVASYEGRSAVARIVVLSALPSPFLRIATPSTLEVGTFQVSALIGAGTTTRDVSAEVTWTSSNPDVLTVARGNVVARSPGTAAITARLNAISATTFVSIRPIRSLP